MRRVKQVWVYRYLGLLILAMGTLSVKAQDTFSIVALDSATGEIGAAGATCIRLDSLSKLINRIVPGKGTIHAQASASKPNLLLGERLIKQNFLPQQIIDSLKKADHDGTPWQRQNSVVGFDVNGQPKTAGFTGSSCITYANHRVAKDYVISGNILAGSHVLDSMENGFKNMEGAVLSDRLMYAMLNAKIIGADKRCKVYQTSSLSAFLKLAAKNDNPRSIQISLDQKGAKNIDPIDSLLDDYLKLNITRVKAPEKICITDTFRAEIASIYGPITWLWKGKKYSGKRFSAHSLSTGTHTLSCTYNLFGTSVNENWTFRVSAGPVVKLPKDTAVCSGTTLLLEAKTQSSASVIWSDGWKGLVRVLMVTRDTLLEVKAIDTYGCSGEPDTIYIQNHEIPVLELGNADTLCFNNNFKVKPRILQPDTPLTYFWNGLPSTKSVYESIAKKSDWIRLKLVDKNNCSVQDSLPIMVDSLNLDITISDSAVCKGDSTIVLAKIFNNYPLSKGINWNGHSSGQTSVSLPAGDHWAKVVSVSGCTDSSVFTIYEHPQAEFNMGNDTTLCIGDELELSYADIVEWDDGIKGKSRRFNVSDPSVILKARLIDDNSCYSLPDSMVVKGKKAPEASFTYQIKSDSVFFMNQSENAENYLWDFGDNSDTDTTVDPVHYYSKDGNYSVVLYALNPFCKTDSVVQEIKVVLSAPTTYQFNRIKAFPNPFHGILNLQLPDESFDVKLLDSYGRVLIQTIAKQNVKLETERLEPGNYLLIIENQQGQLRKKIIKL